VNAHQISIPWIELIILETIARKIANGQLFKSKLKTQGQITILLGIKKQNVSPNGSATLDFQSIVFISEL